jgi:SAM-dependent methyltransferase
VKLTTTNLRTAGQGVGSIYAASTAGSLLGTLVTAFVFIPRFETDHILIGGATVLVLVGALSLALRRRQEALVAVLVPVLLSGAASRRPLPAGLTVVDGSQSLYGLVEVIDDANRNVRFLRADHSVIGAEFLGDHTSAFSFIHQLESVRFLRPQAKDVLQIGLGTGALPTALEHRGFNVDVVEIDPAVVRFAQRYFGFATSGQVAVEDARTFLRRTDRRFDVVVHDTFTGGTTPDHLLSLEVVQNIRRLLRPGGVLALNFAGYVDGPNADASWAVARTVRAVFPNVRIFRDSALDDQPQAAGNVIFFASDDSMDFTVPENASFENDVCRSVLRSFQRWEILTPVPGGATITDNQNPLARLQLPVAEEHFRAMNDLLPVEVWVH